MCGSGDNNVLKLWRELNKTGRKTSNPDHQIPVLLGMQLCIEERAHVDHVGHNLKSAILEVGFK